MKIIADASILIHLSAIGRFHLLKELFRKITVPEGVYTEVVIEGQGLPGSVETSEALKVLRHHHCCVSPLVRVHPHHPIPLRDLPQLPGYAILHLMAPSTLRLGAVYPHP